jgi:hypothetical protein
MVRRCVFCGCLLDVAGETGMVCHACLNAPGEDGLFGPHIEPEPNEPPYGLPAEEDEP